MNDLGELLQGEFGHWSLLRLKCGENEKVAHKAQMSVTDVFITFWRRLWSIGEQTTATFMKNLFVGYDNDAKECWRWGNLCVCPPIDHKKEPIK